MEPNNLDYAIIGTYLGLVGCITGGVSFYQYRKNKRQSNGSTDENDASKFFLAEHSAAWWAVAGAYFSSNIGSDAILGLSSAGAVYGIAAGFFDFASALAFIVLAYVFLPVYRRCNVYTMPEYIERRFNKYCRQYLAGLALILYIISKVSISLYCGSVIIESIVHINPFIAIAVLLALTCAFTALGGLRAVMYVETMNTLLLIVGGLVAAGYSLHAVGGWEGLRQRTTDAGLPQLTHLYSPEGTYALLPLLIGSPWLILFFHCCDQEMVQRGLASNSPRDGRIGSLIAGFLKLTVPWTWCVPGIAARYLFPEALQCNQTTGECANANYAYPSIIMHVLPHGLKGILLAASVAGVLSVLASTFNSASTLVAMDIFRSIRPNASPRALVIVGKLWIVVMTALAVVWLPFLSKLSPSLYTTMQSLNAYTAPPVLCVFMAALFWPRATPVAAFYTLIVGHCIGFGRLIATLVVGVKTDYGNPFLNIYLASDFLLFAAALGGICTAIMIAASLVTKPKSVEELWDAMPECVLRWYCKITNYRLPQRITSPAVANTTPKTLQTRVDVLLTLQSQEEEEEDGDKRPRRESETMLLEKTVDSPRLPESQPQIQHSIVELTHKKDRGEALDIVSHVLAALLAISVVVMIAVVW